MSREMVTAQGVLELNPKGFGFLRDASELEEATRAVAEGEARSRGMTSLGLNVHGQNTVARSLYDSLGYGVTALQMKKPL